MNSADERVHRAGSHQLEQTADGIRQTRCDAAEDQDRDAVAQAALRDLLAQPHQEHRAGHQADDRCKPEPIPGSITRPGDFSSAHGDAERLEQRQHQRAVARVLRDLATTRLAFLLQRFQARNHVAHASA
jgi:hypothetical protein